MTAYLIPKDNTTNITEFNHQNTIAISPSFQDIKERRSDKNQYINWPILKVELNEQDMLEAVCLYKGCIFTGSIRVKVLEVL